MAHIEKYQGSALGKLCGHYNRWADFPGHEVERENIDPSRTPENYNLGPERDCTQVEFINRRIASLDLKRAPRKDAVRMIDTVVTLPGTYHGDVREFFEAVKDTLDEIFGAQNCVSAWVHMDETTPHMHYASVPITEDGRLSAKSLLNRTFMRRFHGRLEEGVCERLGIERAGLTLTDEEREERAGKYVSLPEYKAAQDAVRRKEGDLVELDGAIEGKLLELQDLGEQVEQETRRLECLRQRAGALDKDVEQLGAVNALVREYEDASRGRKGEILSRIADCCNSIRYGIEDRWRAVREAVRTILHPVREVGLAETVRDARDAAEAWNRDHAVPQGSRSRGWSR